LARVMLIVQWLIPTAMILLGVMGLLSKCLVFDFDRGAFMSHCVALIMFSALFNKFRSHL
jgi:hypothetical protein